MVLVLVHTHASAIQDGRAPDVLNTIAILPVCLVRDIVLDPMDVHAFLGGMAKIVLNVSQYSIMVDFYKFFTVFYDQK